MAGRTHLVGGGGPLGAGGAQVGLHGIVLALRNNILLAEQLAAFQVLLQLLLVGFAHADAGLGGAHVGLGGAHAGAGSRYLGLRGKKGGFGRIYALLVIGLVERHEHLAFFHGLVVVHFHFEHGAAHAGQHRVHVAFDLSVVGTFVGFGKLVAREAVVAAGQQNHGHDEEYERVALLRLRQVLALGGRVGVRSRGVLNGGGGFGLGHLNTIKNEEWRVRDYEGKSGK